MLTVACCYWGDWPDPGWGPKYIAALERAVARNLSVPYRFICFADQPEKVPAGIEARKLDAPSWKGCLPKLYVYAPEARLDGRVLLFDLDNVITGSLDDMGGYRGEIAVRAWFRGYDSGIDRSDPRIRDGDMIAFEAGNDASRAIWERFSADPVKAEEWTGGRERFFIRDTVTPDLWQDLLPGQILSWKNHCRDGSLPSDARIVSFHGRPRPHEMLHVPWVRENWSFK